MRVLSFEEPVELRIGCLAKGKGTLVSGTCGGKVWRTEKHPRRHGQIEMVAAVLWVRGNGGLNLSNETRWIEAPTIVSISGGWSRPWCGI